MLIYLNINQMNIFSLRYISISISLMGYVQKLAEIISTAKSDVFLVYLKMPFRHNFPSFLLVDLAWRVMQRFLV